MESQHTLWDLQSGKIVKRLPFASEASNAIVSPDGKYLVSLIQSDSDIQLWDLIIGKFIRVLSSNQPKTDRLVTRLLVDSVTISDDSKKIAVFYNNGSNRIFELESENYSVLDVFHQGIKNILFSPDGILLLGNDHKRVYIWDLNSGNLVKTLPLKYKALGFSPDGKHVISSSEDVCFTWEIDSYLAYDPGHKYVKPHGKRVNDLKFVPDVKQIMSASLDGSCILWDVESGRPVKYLYPVNMTDAGKNLGAADTIESNIKKIFLDNKFLMTGCTYNGHDLIVLRDVVTLRVITTFKIFNFYRSSHFISYKIIAITPEDKKLILAIDNRLELWSMVSGKRNKSLEKHAKKINDVIIFAKGNLALTASDDNTCILWNIVTGKPVKTLEGHSGPVVSIAITSDEKRVVTASKDKICLLWDLASGECLKRFSGHTSEVNSVAFTKNGEYLLTASDDTTCILWAIENGKALKTLEGHREAVKSVFLIRDGEQAVSFSKKLFIVWDLMDGTEISRFAVDDGIECYAIKDNTIVIANSLGEILFFHV